MRSRFYRVLSMGVLDEFGFEIPKMHTITGPKNSGDLRNTLLFVS